MGDILNIKNFNLYVGRYSGRPNAKPPEKELGWYLNNAIHERLPVLALRKRDAGDESPLSWTGGRNTRIAVNVTLDSLKAWQAFRSGRPGAGEKIINRLSQELPWAVVKFQDKMTDCGVRLVREVPKLEWSGVDRVVIAMADIVGKISFLKAKQAPMLGSKVMNFMLPEFFPVWDTAWVKSALAAEDTSDESLGDWFSAAAKKRLSKLPHASPSVQYARYVALMLKELYATPTREYKAILAAYVRYSRVDRSTIKWHFADLAPILFEVCLLGKHNG